MQSPEGTAVPMLRVLPLKLTAAVMGNAGQPMPAFPEKLPAPFAVKVRAAPFLSVTVTVAPLAPEPLQSSGSWPVG